MRIPRGKHGFFAGIVHVAPKSYAFYFANSALVRHSGQGIRADQR